MKNRWTRTFWTALGRAVLGEVPSDGVAELPEAMVKSLACPPPLPEYHITMFGKDLPDKKGRYIYSATWNVLREAGFRRPFRLCSNTGTEVLVPFEKNGVAVTPQGFQKRVPLKLRAYALVGKSAVLRAAGVHYVVCAARYSPEAWSILSAGKCSVCTPDRLAELLSALDFSS